MKLSCLKFHIIKFSFKNNHSINVSLPNNSRNLNPFTFDKMWIKTWNEREREQEGERRLSF